jgi:homoserine O-succinyltransferase/O-acetyltransferase
MPVIFDLYPGESRPGSCITIGLINNMPDEALKATERQFISLLDSASDGMQIFLSLYTLPGVPRNESNSRHIAALYSNMADLWEDQVDGLIVTGREPLAANLTEEPYWESFTKTLEWAGENAHSTVWSCLAAHAAVQQMDGISRAKRDAKLFGVFECARVQDHPLTARTSPSFRLPHSRWNSLPADALRECGYSVLTQIADAEVDTFIKQEKKLFVFFQGHPEYDSDTLLREYRRDIGRYLKGDTPPYPLMPQGYFDPATSDVVNALQQRLVPRKGDELLPEVLAALSDISIENTWHFSARRVYTNWLRYIRAAKEDAVRPKRTNIIGAATGSHSVNAVVNAMTEV